MKQQESDERLGVADFTAIDQCEGFIPSDDQVVDLFADLASRFAGHQVASDEQVHVFVENSGGREEIVQWFHRTSSETSFLD